MIAVLLLHSGDQAWNRPQETNALRRSVLQDFGDLPAHGLNLLLLRSAEDQAHRARVWRALEGLARLHLLQGEAFEVMLGGEPDRMVLRREGLDDDLPGLLAPAGATRHLSHELEGPLEGPEISLVQRGVGRDDSDYCDVWKVETLRDHLRADQDPDSALPEGGELFLERVVPAHRVAIHPGDRVVGEHPLDLLFDLLRPNPQIAQLALRARGAPLGGHDLLPALETDGQMPALIVGQCHITLVARKRFAAAEAPDLRGESPPVEEEQRLFISAEGLFHVPGQGTRDEVPVIGVRQFQIHVHDLHGGHRAIGDSRAEDHALVLTRLPVVVGLEGGGRRAEHHDAVLDVAAHDGNVSTVVTGRAVLFEAVLVLLINDDEAQGPGRSEDG